MDGTRKASVKADERYTVEYIIGAAIRRWKLPEEEYEYYAYAHGRALAPKNTLEMAEIGDGDEVTITAVTKAAGARYSVLRRRNDLKSLKDLGERTMGAVKILRVGGDPLDWVILELGYRSVRSFRVPPDYLEAVTVKVELRTTYPAVRPEFQVIGTIFHPNVFRHGKICYGNWMVTEGLDSVVLRIARLLTFDPELVNIDSPANGDAAHWYRRVREDTPTIFPTDSVIEYDFGWDDVEC